MAETSTLPRTSNLRPGEGLESLLEGRTTSGNVEYIGWRNPISHILLDSFGSQIDLHPASPRNDSWSVRGPIESPFSVPRTAEQVSFFSGISRGMPNAGRLIERSPTMRSNQVLFWRNSYEPTHQSTADDVTTIELADIVTALETEWQLKARALRHAEFAEIMSELDEAIEEAKDHGYPVPSSPVISNARLLLQKLYRIAPRRFEVYPTPDGEIAIDAPGDGSSFVVLCDSKGGALCMANLPGGHRTNYYSTTETLPDTFVSEVLAGLASK